MRHPGVRRFLRVFRGAVGLKAASAGKNPAMSALISVILVPSVVLTTLGLAMIH